MLLHVAWARHVLTPYPGGVLHHGAACLAPQSVRAKTAATGDKFAELLSLFIRLQNYFSWDSFAYLCDSEFEWETSRLIVSRLCLQLDECVRAKSPVQWKCNLNHRLSRTVSFQCELKWVVLLLWCLSRSLSHHDNVLQEFFHLWMSCRPLSQIIYVVSVQRLLLLKILANESLYLKCDEKWCWYFGTSKYLWPHITVTLILVSNPI